MGSDGAGGAAAPGLGTTNARPEAHVWSERECERARALLERAERIARRVAHVTADALDGDRRPRPDAAA